MVLLSKPQDPKSDVRSLFEIFQKSVWSRICEVQSTKFEVCPKSEIKNMSEVRSKSVQSLNFEICLKPEVLCPRSVRSLTSEDPILKSKIATKIQNGWKKHRTKQKN